MTKLEYPGFLLWWQDKNRFPLAVAKEWKPWYLWPEKERREQKQAYPTLPERWLATPNIRMHQD